MLGYFIRLPCSEGGRAEKTGYLRNAQKGTAPGFLRGSFFRISPDYRSSSSTQLPSLLPTYTDCGLMRRSSALCSKQCAVHPATLPAAKVGVKSWLGSPSP